MRFLSETRRDRLFQNEEDAIFGFSCCVVWLTYMDEKGSPLAYCEFYVRSAPRSRPRDFKVSVGKKDYYMVGIASLNVPPAAITKPSIPFSALLLHWKHFLHRRPGSPRALFLWFSRFPGSFPLEISNRPNKRRGQVGEARDLSGSRSRFLCQDSMAHTGDPS